MNNVTFLNGDQALKERGQRHLESRAEDLEFFSECNNEDFNTFLEWFLERAESADGIKELQELIDFHEDKGTFYDYGLCFDFQAATEDSEAYYRYQLSWGGPSDEIRFFEDGTIEYVFLDWYVGVGFDVTNDERFSWLLDWFEGCMMIDWDSKEYSERVYHA